MSPREEKLPPDPATPPQDRKKLPWYFEKTGPAYFNEWSLAHVAWGALFQYYESIEGHIFPAEFRDTSMQNHLGDTAAFVAGMLVVPSPGAARARR